MFPLESSEHMILRQTQESWITVIKRQPLPIQKQPLICSQFKMITKKWQKFCKSLAKDKIPPEQHQETAIRLGKPQRGGARTIQVTHRLPHVSQRAPKRPMVVLAGLGAARAADNKSFLKVEKNPSKPFKGVPLLTKNLKNSDQGWARACCNPKSSAR